MAQAGLRAALYQAVLSDAMHMHMCPAVTLAMLRL